MTLDGEFEEASADMTLERFAENIERVLAPVNACLQEQEVSVDFDGMSILISENRDLEGPTVLFQVKEFEGGAFCLVGAGTGWNGQPEYTGPLDNDFLDEIYTAIVHGCLQPWEREAVLQVNGNKARRLIEDEAVPTPTAKDISPGNLSRLIKS